jgi:hypothetical protein
VQGQLENKYLSVEIQTKCRHCDQEIYIDLDSDMRVFVHEQDAAPLIFMPDVDWNTFAERTIIDSY